MIKSWLENFGLKLTEQKTVFYKAAQTKTVQICIGSHMFCSQLSLKCLGISFDSKLRFQPHLKLAGQRKSTISSALERVLLNIGAPSTMKIADNFNLYTSYELSEHVALIGQHLMRQLA